VAIIVQQVFNIDLSSFFSQNIPTGSLLIALGGVFLVTTPPSTITDSAGNVYTLDISTEIAQSGAAIYRCSATNFAITAGVTTTPIDASSHVTCYSVDLVTGVSALDRTNSAISATGHSASLATGVLTSPTEVVFGVLTTDGSTYSTTVTNAGWTDEYNSVTAPVYVAHQIVSSTASINFAPNWSPGTGYAVVVASYLAPVGGSFGVVVG
jgi:hypothetical protein